MNDMEIMQDALASQKHISSVYNTYSSECVNQQLKSDFLKILQEEQNIESDVFCDMQKRGWYAPVAAQADMINQTKTKFETLSSEL